jgi:hypothetical protein
MNTKENCNAIRAQLRTLGYEIKKTKCRATAHIDASCDGVDKPEVLANLTLSYRHVEDAIMRLGKTIQALEGGVSCYDDKPSRKSENNGPAETEPGHLAGQDFSKEVAKEVMARCVAEHHASMAKREVGPVEEGTTSRRKSNSELEDETRRMQVEIEHAREELKLTELQRDIACTASESCDKEPAFHSVPAKSVEQPGIKSDDDFSSGPSCCNSKSYGP